MAPTLSIDVLRTFHTVARLGQFHAAALHLNKTQSAVSMQIQRLEEMLGGRLLKRGNRGVALTSTGERLLGQVGELITAHDRIMASLEQAVPAGRIRLGLPDEYAGPLLRRVLPLFAIDHPRVEIELETLPSEALAAGIDAGRLDVAVLVRRHEDGHRDALLCQVSPVWVGPAHTSIGMDGQLPLALHADRCPYRRAAVDALALAGMRWRVVLTSPSSSAIIASVEAGLALAVVDPWQVTGAMRILGKADGLPELPPHQVVLRKARGTDDELLGRLREQLRNAFPIW